MIINYLEQSFALVPDARIAFIYFNHKEKPSEVELLGNILKQVLQQQTGISCAIRDLYKNKSRKNSHCSLTEVSELLAMETGSLSKLFLVVDALDECQLRIEARDHLFSHLQNLPALRLLVTSRPHISIPSVFDTCPLDIRADKSDMETFIRARLENNERLQRYVDTKSRPVIIDTIIQKCDGM